MSIGGLQVANQTFGLATQVSAEFNDSPIDGLLGMAFGSIAACRKPTLFENLLRGGGIQPFFSLSLLRGQVDGSELCIGCYDATKVLGGIFWIPVKYKVLLSNMV